jgi:uncharacterized membrane protein HdeD (DUF308 family)
VIVQDEKGTSYWGGFEVKSTIRGLVAINLGLLYFAMVGTEGYAPTFWLAVIFFIGGFLSCIGNFNGRARLHAQGSWSLPFNSDPRS